jgi:phosphoglycerol transferase MdoB-like AlkP superfamily enzyme
MNFEDFQKTWQSQASSIATINPDILLKEVRHNQRQFRATIFWRDTREVGVAILLTAFFLYQGIRHPDWTFYLLAFAALGVSTFIVVDRWIQRKKKPVSSETLKTCVETSLAEVNHQIWLLQNVFWWYLLPFAIAVEIFICVSTGRKLDGDLRMAIVAAIFALLVILLYWGIYWLNQCAVRKSLEPRRQELESLLTALNQ